MTSVESSGAQPQPFNVKTSRPFIGRTLRVRLLDGAVIEGKLHSVTAKSLWFLTTDTEGDVFVLYTAVAPGGVSLV